MTAPTQKDKVFQILSDIGAARSKELIAHGISSATIHRLVAKGHLERVSRGLYRLSHAAPVENTTLVNITKCIPESVICLLSALAYHGLTTQLPHQTWIAIHPKSRHPKVDLPLRILRFSGPSLTEGIDTHRIEGTDIRIYCAAKTVADCFKFRNKIGTDVAVEALRDYIQQQAGSIDDLWDYATICRVTTVITPYLEAIS